MQAPVELWKAWDLPAPILWGRKGEAEAGALGHGLEGRGAGARICLGIERQ